MQLSRESGANFAEAQLFLGFGPKLVAMCGALAPMPLLFT
jgi:hypothetical protein